MLTFPIPKQFVESTGSIALLLSILSLCDLMCTVKDNTGEEKTHHIEVH